MSNREINVVKVPTDENLADALTKGVDAAAIAKHLVGVGAQVPCGRHVLAPKIDEEEQQ